jgi:hypothetical protein
MRGSWLWEVAAFLGGDEFSSVFLDQFEIVVEQGAFPVGRPARARPVLLVVTGQDKPHVGMPQDLDTDVGQFSRHGGTFEGGRGTELRHDRPGDVRVRGRSIWIGSMIGRPPASREWEMAKTRWTFISDCVSVTSVRGLERQITIEGLEGVDREAKWSHSKKVNGL